MASTPLVVLAGNAVTTWDCSNEPEEPSTFYPQGDLPIADVAWNHNGQVLASCSVVSTDEQVHNNVVLTAAQSGNPLDSLQHNHQWKRPAGAATSLAFGGKSRYLCIGDASGAVCLWDLKKKLRVRQFFHDEEPARQVSLDPTDTYVMSLTSRALRTYKLREGIPAATWTPPPQGDYAFTQYSTSTLEPNLAAIGTDDGSLLLYDITNMQKSAPFFGLSQCHDGPITGVAFSSTNSKLLASTSADGALKFFDKGSGSLIHELARLPAGISSLTLNVDGISCAVGTTSGEVAIYDLRQTGTPLASMDVQGEIRTVRFSPPPKHHRNTTHSTTPASLKKASHSNAEQKEMEDLRRDLEQATSFNDNPSNYHNQSPAMQQQQQQQQQTRKQSSIFSAPQHQINMEPTSSLVSEDPQTSYAGPMIDSPQKSSNRLPQHNSAPSSPQKSLAQQSMASSTFGGEGGGGSLQGVPSPYGSPSKQQQQPRTASINFVPPSPRPTSQQQGQQQQQPLLKSDLSQIPVVDTPEKGGGSDRRQSDPAPVQQQLNVEEIRDVVRDEVEKLQDDLEESLRNLHMDMIRQFHLQSQELNSALSSQLAAMDQLREENQRLREENDFLKRHHQQQQQQQQQQNPPSQGQRKHLANTGTIFGT